MLKSRVAKIGRKRSRGTSQGMRLYYQTSCPRCKGCKKVYLIRAERRRLGLCAKFEKLAIREN